MMMAGMTQGLRRSHLNPSDLNNIAVIEDLHILLRHCAYAAPQFLHVIAKNSGGRLDQPRRIYQMWRAAGMHIDARTQFGEAERGAGVVEMNVTEKHMTNVIRLDTNFGQTRDDVWKCR